MYKCLKFFHFGPDFVRWIHILNDDTQLCVIQNGFFSQFFGIGRGCRQGDPTSPYIFNLCIEILAILFRHNADIKGIKIGKTEYSILQYADDTVIFLDGSEKSLKNSLDLLFQFSKYSGLTSNFDKTSAVWIGSKINCKDRYCQEYNINWTEENFTILGIKFNAALINIDNINFNDKIANLKKEIVSWSKRNLTPLGKITVIKTLLLSKITHLFISLPNPNKELIDELEKTLFRFIWNGKVDRIARKTMYQDFNNGGCRMTHIPSFIKALKLTWIRRLLHSNSSWVHLFNDECNSSIGELCQFGNEYILKCQKETKNKFWKDVLQSLYEFNVLLPKTENLSILKLPIWYNESIKINRKTVFYKNWYLSGISIVQDLFTNTGDFMSLYDFEQKYNFRPHFTLLQGLKLAILSTWPQLRNNSDIVPRPTRASFIELICKNDKGSRVMYDIFVKQMYSNPKYENKWARDLNLNPQFNWQKANNNILKHTKDTQIIWFQIRLLHRILPTKRNLYFMRIKDNPLCNFCRSDIDTYTHAFYDCPEVRIFWNEIELWMRERTQDDITLNIISVILGVHDPALDLILTFCKMYIFQKAREEARLLLFELKVKLYQYYLTEKKVYYSKNKQESFTKRWQKYRPLFDN